MVWDGVRASGGRPAEVRVNLADGPVLNLNLPGPGRMDAAAPTVAATISDAAIAEPPAVSLDAAGK